MFVTGTDVLPKPSYGYQVARCHIPKAAVCAGGSVGNVPMSDHLMRRYVMTLYYVKSRGYWTLHDAFWLLLLGLFLLSESQVPSSASSSRIPSSVLYHERQSFIFIET